MDKWNLETIPVSESHLKFLVPSKNLLELWMGHQILLFSFSFISDSYFLND